MNEVIDFIVEAFAASWIEIVMPGNCIVTVEAFAASWIEIPPPVYNHVFLVEAFGLRGLKSLHFLLLVSCPCRSLCGFVGLKLNAGYEGRRGEIVEALRLRGLKFCPPFSRAVDTVEAFAASGIEIGKDGEQPAAEHTSKPLRLRGLKLPTLKYLWKIIRRSLCGFVD
ncbi:MAG: hypothetical protein ACLUOI_17665 [Eisenbergiella sp.]